MQVLDEEVSDVGVEHQITSMRMFWMIMNFKRLLYVIFMIQFVNKFVYFINNYNVLMQVLDEEALDEWGWSTNQFDEDVLDLDDNEAENVIIPYIYEITC